MADGTSTGKVRVVVADDHPIFREGIVRALAETGSVEVVGEADDGDTAFELIRRHVPDVALVDYRMPGMDGVRIVTAARENDLATRVLILSAHDASAIVYAALQEGAAGFLPKESSRDEIVAAVLQCAEGQDVVPSTVAAGLAAEIRRRAEPQKPLLTEREQEVLAGIASGRSVPQIAASLYLAPTTVKTHLQRVYEKLGVNDRGAAVAEAMRRKLLQ